MGQISAEEEVEEEVREESHVAPSLLPGLWTSCRAAPCHELSRDGRKKEREREKGMKEGRKEEQERGGLCWCQNKRPG